MSRLRFLVLFGLLLGGCDAIVGEAPPDDDVPQEPETPPADELEARLEAVTGEGPSRTSLLLLSAELMERGGYARRERPVSDVVRRAARTTCCTDRTARPCSHKATELRRS